MGSGRKTTLLSHFDTTSGCWRSVAKVQFWNKAKDRRNGSLFLRIRVHRTTTGDRKAEGLVLGFWSSMVCSPVDVLFGTHPQGRDPENTSPGATVRCTTTVVHFFVLVFVLGSFVLWPRSSVFCGPYFLYIVRNSSSETGEPVGAGLSEANR